MTESQQPSALRAAVDTVAADYYAKRQGTPQSGQDQQSTPPPAQWYPTSQAASCSAAAQQSVDPIELGNMPVGSDITAWQTALQSLPAEFKNQLEPSHPLAAALAQQPTLRQIEWNPFRHQGGFVPRTAHDYSSMMIYVSGQINPNPCRNCLLKNGPYAQCIVSPPDVLADSTLRHGCANCTYQNQYKKCTNDPISEEEMTRRLMAKGHGQPRRSPLMPRKPKAKAITRSHKDASPSDYKQQVEPSQLQMRLPDKQQQHSIRRQTGQNNPGDSFADKVRQARAWSPRMRRRMKAEALQWQAALATVEIERPRKSAEPGPIASHGNTTDQHPLPAATHQPLEYSQQFMPLPFTVQRVDETEEDDDDTDMSEDVGVHRDTWVGFGNTAATIKPPH